MKLETRTYNLYHNLGYWFLSFIVLVLVGFYRSYFAVIFEPTASILHIHFGLMTVWITMLIVQPFLIKYKRLEVHRIIGKISYVLVPLILLSTYFAMKNGYHVNVDRLSELEVDGAPKYPPFQIKQMVGRAFAIPFFYMSWMGLFYALAIINRKRSAVHARYMVATALTILGPTVDRIVSVEVGIQTLFFLPAFILIDVILIILLLRDKTQRKEITTLSICLGVYVISQGMFFAVRGTNWWAYFMGSIMNA